MNLRNVVWDMDGTLLNSSRVVPEAFVRAVAELAGPPVAAEDVVNAYWRGTPEVILAFLMQRQLEPLESESYYRALDGAEVAPYPGVAETLAALRRRNLPITVFTGASTRAAELLLRSAGLTADLVIGGDSVDRPKPAADGMLLAARRLGTPAEHLALVGDSPLDLQAAKAAGSHSASAAWGHMYDPAEPADSILHTPDDVLELLATRTPRTSTP
ncbi:HAD family hydrolase, partial [Streptomyces varsoviensis]|uniref:Hydrolase n=1 Tax=Streptomyces varsoviensis TaxID=67373 RepID=A0ABR5JE75_9ACTN